MSDGWKEPDDEMVEAQKRIAESMEEKNRIDNARQRQDANWRAQTKDWPHQMHVSIAVALIHNGCPYTEVGRATREIWSDLKGGWVE